MANKVQMALITGGGRGLGSNMAKALASSGIDIIVTYLNDRASAEATSTAIKNMGRKSAVLQLDTSSISSIENFINIFSNVLNREWETDRFDYLINNAGIGINQSFESTTETQFDELLNIHLKGPFFLTQKLLPLMNDGGSIVNVSTGLTRFATPGYSAYSSMKGAMEVLTKYQAKELGKRGIRVNVVAPGAIETDFNGGFVRDNPQVNKFITSVTALGRVGMPDDIGPVVAFLCSDASKWVTAQRIEVSGGQNL